MHERTSWPRQNGSDKRRKLKRARQGRERKCAPGNTTQFIMKDHAGEAPSEVLQSGHDGWPQVRARSCSFTSMDSGDEGFNYTSPSSEEEFVDQDFAQEYQNRIIERLESMDKCGLINECMELEGKVEHLETQLNDAKRGEVPMSPTTAEKIMVFEKEIASLSEENRRLKDLQKKEERRRRRKVPARSSSSSGSSSSSTSSTDSGQDDGGNSSNSKGMSEEEHALQVGAETEPTSTEASEVGHTASAGKPASALAKESSPQKNSLGTPSDDPSNK